jgi:hypothetical protein
VSTLDSTELDAEISKLDRQVQSALTSGGNWRAIWDEIRQISGAFREIRYLSRAEKDSAWQRFQTIVQSVKEQQEEDRKQREESTKKAAELDAQIAQLDVLVTSTSGAGGQWTFVWEEIRRIGVEFKGIRYPSREAKDTSWQRFQGIVDTVKHQQAEVHKERDAFRKRSEEHKWEILACARDAMPMNALEDMAYIFSGMALLETVVTEAVNLLPGPSLDPWRQALEARSRRLAEGRHLLSAYKGEMLKKDKDEAFEALNRASELLERDWTAWKEAKRRDYEARQEARRARDEARRQKQEEWQDRMRQRISNLEAQLQKLEEVEARAEANIEKLRDMEYSARGDTHRERVRGWLEEATDKLQSIQERKATVQEWLRDACSKLY